MTVPLPARAWVRHVASTYDRCLRERGAPIDVARARGQHAGYVTALREAGIDVVEIAQEDACPDCCFVEDTAVLWDGGGVLTRPGAPSRRPETAAVAAALPGLPALEPPATLDGGDALRVADRLFVGRSDRTSPAGIAALRARCPLPIVEVEVRAGLHLKSAVTLADATTALVRDDVDPAPLEAAGLRLLEAPEPEGANVLALGRVVLVSRAAPRTGARLARLGLTVVPLELSELHAGDGGLTCLSLRMPAPGSWCA